MSAKPTYAAGSNHRVVRIRMNDFDFFTGTWDVANRWRADFLDPDSEWEEFPGISHASGTSMAVRTSTRSRSRPRAFPD
jgi:hypothetical protein